MARAAADQRLQSFRTVNLTSLAISRPGGQKVGPVPPIRKRGGSRERLSLHEIESALEHASAAPDTCDEALLVLESSLQRLERQSPRQAQIVECRFFGGMTIPETAEALSLSPSTVTRGWAAAQAWLYRDVRQALEKPR